MEAINSLKEKIKKWYRALPDKKKYIEFFTAILSVPVLITVILINLNNLNQNKKTETQTAKDKTTPIQVQINAPTTAEKQKSEVLETPTPTTIITALECKKEVGPVVIVSPSEKEVVTDDPVCIEISYKIGEYCAVAWSYKINDGPWSSYTDKDICLYNLTNGDKTLKLKVKSIASSDEEILERNFVYDGNQSTATSSASQ